MMIRELREILEEYDGEMEITILDEDRNAYDVDGVTIDHRNKEPMLAIKFW